MCHGANFDDGPLARAAEGRRVHAQVRRQVGARAVRRAAHDDADGQSRLAVRPRRTRRSSALILAQNAIVAGRPPLPADPQLLAAMQVPAGGFSFMAFSPYTARPAVDRPTPLADFNAVTDDAIAAPPAGDWLGWRRSYDAQGFSPLREIDTRNVENLRLAWSWTMPAGSRRKRAARARRHDLRASVRRHRAGARREDRRSALAVHAHARARRLAVSQARPRAARQSALSRHVGRARRRARRRDGRSRLGHDGRRLPPPRRLERRAARRARQGHDRHDGHGRRARNSAGRRSSASTKRPAPKRGGSARSRNPASPATRAGTAFRSRSAAARRSGRRAATTRDRPRLLRHGQHLRHGPAAEAECAGHDERRALHELDAGRESRHRRARLALPAFPERPVGSRLGVRAADPRLARERHDAPRRADGRQDRHLRRRRRAHGRVRVLDRSRA